MNTLRRDLPASLVVFLVAVPPFLLLLLRFLVFVTLIFDSSLHGFLLGSCDRGSGLAPLFLGLLGFFICGFFDNEISFAFGATDSRASPRITRAAR